MQNRYYNLAIYLPFTVGGEKESRHKGRAQDEFYFIWLNADKYPFHEKIN